MEEKKKKTGSSEVSSAWETEGIVFKPVLGWFADSRVSDMCHKVCRTLI